MRVEVLEAQGFALGLEVTEEPESTREVPDERALLLADAGRGEGLDHTLFVEHAQRGVLRVRHAPRFVSDPLQHSVAVELRRERKARRVDRLQLLALLLQLFCDDAKPLRVRAVPRLEGGELPEDRGRECEDAGDADHQRDEM